MCGRYTLSSPGEVIAELFELGTVPQIAPRYNVAPTQKSPVVRVLEPGQPRQLDLLRWGLIPYWAKEAAIGNRMINARSESVAEKPAYRWSFKKHRCLVVVDGFYEWTKVAGGKQPFHIRREDRQPFAFAGLWSSWKPAEGQLEGQLEGQPVETFTILTTSANELMRPLHDRMPVILDRADFDLWLDPTVGDGERLLPLLVPAAGEGFEAVAVSRRVNSPANEGPGCVEAMSAMSAEA